MKHIEVPRNTKYRLFKRGNAKIKQLIDAVVDMNRSSEKKRIRKYPKVNYKLMIQIQDWIVKYYDVIQSLITKDTLLIIDECTGKYFYL